MLLAAQVFSGFTEKNFAKRFSPLPFPHAKPFQLLLLSLLCYEKLKSCMIPTFDAGGCWVCKDGEAER